MEDGAKPFQHNSFMSNLMLLPHSPTCLCDPIRSVEPPAMFQTSFTHPCVASITRALSLPVHRRLAAALINLVAGHTNPCPLDPGHSLPRLFKRGSASSAASVGSGLRRLRLGGGRLQPGPPLQPCPTPMCAKRPALAVPAPGAVAPQRPRRRRRGRSAVGICPSDDATSKATVAAVRRPLCTSLVCGAGHRAGNRLRKPGALPAPGHKRCRKKDRTLESVRARGEAGKKKRETERERETETKKGRENENEDWKENDKGQEKERERDRRGRER